MVGETHKGFLKDQIREVVFGLEDGLVSTLGVITGIASGTLNSNIVVMAGFVVIFVESLSMAVGTYLSSKSVRDIQEQTLKEEIQEIRKEPEKERKELIQFYKERGFSNKEMEVLIKKFMSDEKLMLEEMAYKELGIIPYKLETPEKNSVFMGISYIIGGFVPITAYLLFPLEKAMLLAVVFTGIALFIAGAFTSKYRGKHWLKAGLQMVVIALSTAAIGYLIGSLFRAPIV